MSQHNSVLQICIAAVVCFSFMQGAEAQDSASPEYLSPQLSPETRAMDLVHRMTLEEKDSQLVNQARAIPRLKVPAYDWWSESLHGVAVGRGQETYGEDPYLTGRMGVAFVTGMQGDDPKYYRVIATPKHYDVHSGPEPTRHFADVDVSRHDQLDTYEPAFRAAVTEGKAGSVMCAYNAINGQPACANQFLLQDQLRGKWGFQGYVVSDCGAVIDIFIGHHYRPTQPQASAISLERGMDNECADFLSKVKDNHDYKPYIDAVQQGYLSESAIGAQWTGFLTPPDSGDYLIGVRASGFARLKLMGSR